jgi:hypothetical protein
MNDLYTANNEPHFILKHSLLNHIRNLRELNGYQLDTIKKQFSNDDKLELIKEYNKIVKSLVDVLNLSI